MTERDHIAQQLQEEFDLTLSERIDRFMEVNSNIQQFVPCKGPFAAVSQECFDLYRDGRFYGCITLCQSVIEAIVRSVWQVEIPNRKERESDFKKIRNGIFPILKSKGLLEDELEEKIVRMWDRDRHTFHHLKRNIPTDQSELKERATWTLELLRELEKTFFGYSQRDGKLVRNHPEYWLDSSEGETLVFVRN